MLNALASDQSQQDGNNCYNQENMDQPASAENKISEYPSDKQDYSQNIKYVTHDFYCLTVSMKI
jgi:hypothetical protein